MIKFVLLIKKIPFIEILPYNISFLTYTASNIYSFSIIITSILQNIFKIQRK